jgi:hypothetical protein
MNPEVSMKTHHAYYFAIGLAVTFASLPAVATTYQVGPTRTNKTIGALAGKLVAGDVVEVDGDATYAGGIVLGSPGAAGNPITVRGIQVNGKRPILSGGTNTIEIQGDHYVLEGFDITAGTFRCVYHHSDDVVMRDLIVHDCPAHGLLGADQDSGSLTLEYSRFYGSGSGGGEHQIYMATDEVAHPGSVFRMQHCYVHDGVGGNNVKSRAERNEIYYNWIEGAFYSELELIGPDPNGAKPSWTEGLVREDSDVVGNVLRQTNTFAVMRFGGDGTGQSQGRYRFVNNTVITQPGGGAVFRLFDGLESVEMHNSVFVVEGGSGLNLLREVEAVWSTGSRVVAGSNNWVLSGASNIPGEWTGTIQGNDPGFVGAPGLNPRPTDVGALHDAGATSLVGPSGHPFPSPLEVPAFEPPMHALEAPGGAGRRAITGPIDIGAFESTIPTLPDGGMCGCSGASNGSGGASNAGGGASNASGGVSNASGGASSASGGATSRGRGGSGAIGAPGTGGASTGSGNGGGGAAFDGGVSSNASSGDKGGCGCRVRTSAEPRRGVLVTALFLLMAIRRLRRARARRKLRGPCADASSPTS